jgi:uncharacterized protein
MHRYTNQLIHETSPYLLQHAHNPVNWFAWNDETLKKAKEENKPILVSIGYAACHWCHVMERESFEDEVTAAIMNANFISIKIDREERPDLDHIYMDAVQAITGSGGWPLNVFLTPEGKPFYGGTYFPPQRAFNRPSWQEVLNNISQAFYEKRYEIDAQAENLTNHLIQSNGFGIQKFSESEKTFKKENLNEVFQNIMKFADIEWGGFGKVPKFPQTSTIQFLLRYYHINKKDSNPSMSPEISAGENVFADPIVHQALLSLDKMIEGGIYDQLGGGFARYSTDAEWLAPHFEKMLYDNALLVSVLSEAYQLTGKERYKEVINETIGFVQRELLDDQKGFYAALDADSEGEEGKFYVWDLREVKEILGNDAAIFCEYYDITSHGNWEQKNILHVREPLEKFSSRKNISIDKIKQLLEQGKKKLLEQRNKRIRPLLDDKIILGWNALMNTACSKAFAATGNEQFRQLAIDNMHFLFQEFNIKNSDEFYHTWKNSVAKYPAFIDDYAFLIQALIHLQEITADTKWLKKAKLITEFIIENFSETQAKTSHASDSQPSFFFYTGKNQHDVIIRKKEVYDGAVPSGNSTMAYNLYHLSILFDKKEWKQRAIQIVSFLQKSIISYPTSFANWACLLQEMITGTYEIAVTGKDFTKLHVDLLEHYLPHRVLMASATSEPDFALLADKPVTNPPSIWLCKDFVCQQPVESLKELTVLINSLKRE